MNTKNRDIVFFDLDDTLISTYHITDYNDLSKVLDNISEEYHIRTIYHQVGYSVIVSRPWSHTLIYEVAQLVGAMNVAILTKNTYEFVERLIYNIGFPIDKDRVFTAEDMYRNYSMFSDTNNILVDDGSYDYHNHGLISKVAFLGLNRHNLIQVSPFNPMALDVEGEDDWKPILKRIEKVLKTKR